jgi:hypothetical protein
LIGQVQMAFLDWQVLDLTKVYSKMYIDDITQRLAARDGVGKIGTRQVVQIIQDLVRRAS